jgi:hypothetical protein
MERQLTLSEARAALDTGATLTFGATHASVAPRVTSGRHRTQRLSVSAELAWPQTARLVIGGVIALGCLTVAGAIAASADGARRPVTIASMFVAGAFGPNSRLSAGRLSKGT